MQGMLRRVSYRAAVRYHKLMPVDLHLPAAHSIPRGFQWGATRAGIKASGNPDIAFALANHQAASAAAMFTSNLVVAAPITVGRRHLAATGGRVRAVLINSGNANCATGEPGIQGCVSTCVAAAETFGCIFDEVLPSSTGIIGVPFPVGEGRRRYARPQSRHRRRRPPTPNPSLAPSSPPIPA